MVSVACPPHRSVAPPSWSPVPSRLRTMSSQRLVLGLPQVLPSLPPSPAPPCGPCVEGWLRATPHSSLRPTTEPFETLHLDVWGPASCPGPEQESFFLVVVDDYSRYTTVFPLAKKSDVTSTLIWWLLTTMGTRHRRVSCLHSDRGGLVMEIARTSMIHARAPHFMWPYVVRYAAHQLNLWPRVSRLGVSPTSLWTGSPGVALRFRDSSDFTLNHPPLHRFFDSREIRFNESVPYYTCYPCRGLLVPPPLSSSLPLPLLLLWYSLPHLVQPRQSLQQPTALPPQAAADPEGVGVRSADPGGATSGGVGVGAESVPARGPCAGGAGVGAEPVSAGGSSLRGAGGSQAVPRGATIGGAVTPSAGPGETGTGRVAAGGAGSGGGATGALESGLGATTTPDTTPPPHPYPTQHQALLRRAPAGATVAGGAAAAATTAAAATAAVAGAAAAATAAYASCLWPLGPWSPLPFSFLLPLSCYLRSHSVLTASLSTLVIDYYLCRLDYATHVVAAPPTSPLAVEVGSALGCDALEDMKFELEFLPAALPHLFAMLLALEGDPDAFDILTPRTYAEAVSGPWASQWRAAIDAEMASYVKLTNENE
ncbi:unnamed protein product [Closterium sp. NIES-54]